MERKEKVKRCPQCKSRKIEESEFSLPDTLHYHCLDCGYFFSDSGRKPRGYKKMKDSFNVEVVSFYPSKHEKDTGNFEGILQILLVDFEANLRGVKVKFEGDRWYFSLPFISCKALDTHDHIRLPVFSFTDRAKTRALKDIIIDKGKAFIEATYLKL